jgi:hypothetical protein
MCSVQLKGRSLDLEDLLTLNTLTMTTLMRLTMELGPTKEIL